MTRLLLAQAAILVLCALVEGVKRLGPLDRAALLAFLLLTVATRPGLAEHHVAVSDHVLSVQHSRTQHSGATRAALAAVLAPQLHHTDAVLFTTTSQRGRLRSVGVWGRVFVRDTGD